MYIVAIYQSDFTSDIHQILTSDVTRLELAL